MIPYEKSAHAFPTIFQSQYCIVIRAHSNRRLYCLFVRSFVLCYLHIAAYFFFFFAILMERPIPLLISNAHSSIPFIGSLLQCDSFHSFRNCSEHIEPHSLSITLSIFTLKSINQSKSIEKCSFTTTVKRRKITSIKRIFYSISNYLIKNENMKGKKK